MSCPIVTNFFRKKYGLSNIALGVDGNKIAYYWVTGEFEDTFLLSLYLIMENLGVLIYFLKKNFANSLIIAIE